MALSLLLFLSFVLALAVAVVAPVLRRLFRKPSVEEITLEWMENFSLDRYRTMSGLLANDDFAFLSRQPGFDLSLHKKLRRERLQIFRQYFNRLIMDFNRLQLAGRALVARNREDSSELAALLFHSQVRFYLAVFRTECVYTFCRVGLSTIDVKSALDVKTLLEPLHLLSEQIAGLARPIIASSNA